MDTGIRILKMPSFFLQMFKRGRYVYRRSVVADETDDGKEKVKREREERERFAVAAIAFCIKHYAVFKRHFVQVVAKLPSEEFGDPRFEPRMNEDLVLEGERHVLILEFKIDAPLQDDQNPGKELFWKDGYGRKILSTYSSKELHYILVGTDFDQQRCDRLRGKFDMSIRCSSVPWQALGIGKRGESSLEDLYDCLASLGVSTFRFRHMKKKTTYTHDAKSGLETYNFLEWVLGELELEARSDSSVRDRAFGMTIGRTKKSEMAQKLAEATQTTGYPGWIGYAMDENGNGRPAVALYFSQKDAQNEVKKRLEKSFGKVEVHEFTLWIEKEGEGHLDDGEWFTKLLKTAASV